MVLGFPAWVTQTSPGYLWTCLTLGLAGIGWPDSALAGLGNDWPGPGSGSGKPGHDPELSWLAQAHPLGAWLV